MKSVKKGNCRGSCDDSADNKKPWLVLFICAVFTQGLSEIEGVHWERAGRVSK